jgi:Rrf2 family cysteine metabolism transcriptional repressor
MLINTKGYYGLKVALFFAFSKNHSFSIKEISKRIDVSEKVLEQVLLLLKNKGMLSSKRGPNGGYTATVDFMAMSVMDIINKMGGTLEVLPINNFANSILDDVLMNFVSELEESIKTKMKNVAVKDMVKQIKEKVTQDGLSFVI